MWGIKAPHITTLIENSSFSLCDAFHKTDVTRTKKLFNINKIWTIQLILVILLAIKIVLKNNTVIKCQIGIDPKF